MMLNFCLSMEVQAAPGGLLRSPPPPLVAASHPLLIPSSHPCLSTKFPFFFSSNCQPNVAIRAQTSRTPEQTKPVRTTAAGRQSPPPNSGCTRACQRKRCAACLMICDAKPLVSRLFVFAQMLAILFCALVDVPTLLTILLLMASLCPCPVLHSDRHLAQREAAFLVSPPIPFTLHPPSHPSASIHRCLAIGAHTLVASSDPYASAHHNTIQRTRHTAPPPAIG
jgi:hypothetical protein